MEIDYTLIAITFVVAIVGLILGRNWLISMQQGSVPLKKELKYWQDYAIQQEDEVKHWKGKFNKRDQPPQLDGTFSVEKLPDMIGDIFPMLSGFLPKWAQPFFKQPALQKMMIDWFVKNPDKGAELIGKFFGAKGGKPPLPENTQQNGTNASQPVPEIY